jgi:hypothetical protein
MDNLFELLQGKLSDQMIDTLSKKIGEPNRQKTAEATQDALSALMAGLAKNTKKPRGAASLSKALDKDHDGSAFDNIMDMLKGDQSKIGQKATDGAGILEHIFGKDKEKVAGELSKKSSIDTSKMSSLMEMLAPLVMGALGKSKKSGGFDITDLFSMLDSSSKKQSQKSGTMDVLKQLLDRNGNGSSKNDLIGMGMRMLKRFISKK